MQNPGGITVSEQGTIAATGAQGVETFRMIALRVNLRFQARTGMKMSRGISAVKVAQDMGLTTKRTAKGAFEDVNAAMVAAGYESMSLD